MKEWLLSIGSSKYWQKQHEYLKENHTVLNIDPDTPRG